MEFLDFLAILLITAIGYPAGFMTVKINNLLVIAFGKLWSSGHAQKRYIPIGVIIAACYTLVAFRIVDFTAFTDPPFQMLGPLILTTIFSGLYAVGIYHADKRFGKIGDIMEAIIKLTYASGNSPDEKEIRNDTIKNANCTLEAMPESNKEALELLFFVFDSGFMVFFISLSSGRLRARRFIRLCSEQQMEYLEKWAKNTQLYYAIQALKSLIGFSYYTSPRTWKDVGYSGTLLGRSYWK
jgi:hypothetical protein